MASPFQIQHTSLFLLLLFSFPLPRTCQTTQATNSTPSGSDSTASQTTPVTTTGPATTSYINDSSNTSLGCGAGLEPMYWNLCDRQAAWGIVVESLASLGFMVSSCLLVGLLFWTLWACVSSRRRHSGIAGTVASTSLFLLSTAALFALTFAFVIRLTPQTCPTRLFLFGVAFSLAFSCLLARCLSLLGFAMARGCGEPCLALALFLVQAVIATEWLIIVLVRDGMACEYSQGEFVMLLIYVLCLLAVALVLSLRSLCRSCFTYSYSYTGGGGHRRTQVQATLLCLTLLLSAAIWVVWVALLTRGNPEMGRRPHWDDPVLSIALVANGWVLLLGHGLVQVVCLCKGESRSKDAPLDFGGWTSPGAQLPLPSPTLKEGRENGSFENDGRRKEPALRSPYESGFSMTERNLLLFFKTTFDFLVGVMSLLWILENESFLYVARPPVEFHTIRTPGGARPPAPLPGRRRRALSFLSHVQEGSNSPRSIKEIDPDKDYSIPRPQTTNIQEPYDEYYGRTLSD